MNKDGPSPVVVPLSLVVPAAPAVVPASLVVPEPTGVVLEPPSGVAVVWTPPPPDVDPAPPVLSDPNVTGGGVTAKQKQLPAFLMRS